MQLVLELDAKGEERPDISGSNADIDRCAQRGNRFRRLPLEL